jgi:ribosomal protein S1
MKRLRINPWDELAAKFQVGDIIEAPVVRISNFGVFVALHGGINGLIHLSEISNTIVKNIEDFVHVGDSIKAKIITFDPTEKRIGLSMKALEEAPVKAEAEVKTEKAVEKKPKKAKADEMVNVEASEVTEEKKPAAKKKAKEVVAE